MSDDRPFTPGPAALHDRVRLLEDRVAALERLLAPPRKD
jgi:hypothetical protein